MNMSLIKQNFGTKVPETMMKDRETEFQNPTNATLDPSPDDESSPYIFQIPSGQVCHSDSPSKYFTISQK